VHWFLHHWHRQQVQEFLFALKLLS
jgi:hypothetical protein